MAEPIIGTIDPNATASIAIVPLTEAGEPKALEGPLGASFTEPSVYAIDNTDPLSLVLDVEPPADIDAQPVTHVRIFDTADDDPNLEIVLNWQKATVEIRATRFSVTVSSKPIAP